MANQVFGGRWLVLVAMTILVLAGVTTTAQRSDTCRLTTRAGPNQNRVNVSCSCTQRLTGTGPYKVDNLSINQTGCSSRGLELSWPDLENIVAPETLVLYSSHVFFAAFQPSRVWNSSITKLTFIDSTFELLPANAFGGMKLLEEIRFLGGTIGTIKSDAFSGLQRLKVIEIANVTVKSIESRAFNNLASLEDLTIVRSRVENVESEAVSLLRQNNDEVRRCTIIGRSSSRSYAFLRDIMARQLSSTVNLSLPDYGSRFLLLNNTIQTLSSRAITSETLGGFLIVGGNHIENVHARAFSVELYNECEISAALFIGNRITNLGSSALAGLKGRDEITYQALIALSNNVFLSVAEEGFLLDKSMGIFSIGENKFQCVCGKFDWILSNANSQNQQDLERELVLEAKCLDGTSLISFTVSCIGHGDNTPMVSTSTARPTVRPTVPQPNSAQAHAVSLMSVTISVLNLALYWIFM